MIYVSFMILLVVYIYIIIETKKNCSRILLICAQANARKIMNIMLHKFCNFKNKMKIIPAHKCIYACNVEKKLHKNPWAERNFLYLTENL